MHIHCTRLAYQMDVYRISGVVLSYYINGVVLGTASHHLRCLLRYLYSLPLFLGQRNRCGAGAVNVPATVESVQTALCNTGIYYILVTDIRRVVDMRVEGIGTQRMTKLQMDGYNKGRYEM